MLSDETINQGRTFAIVSYLTILGTLIAFFINRDKGNAFTSFHIRQALGLWLLEIVLAYAVTGFNDWSITIAFWIFIGALFVYGIYGAIMGKTNAVPLIGEFFQRFFKGIR